MDAQILVVEDEKEIQEYILGLLRKNDYVVLTARTGAEALKMVEEQTPDLLLLDLNLPDISGEGVCSEVRKNFPFLPIIMLTAKDTVNDKVKGFRAGADDYISKPFAPEELLERIHARLRKKEHDDKIILGVADLELDPMRLEVRRAGKEIPLTAQEFKLLHYLMTNPGIVLTRQMILNRVWNSSPDIETRVVDVYLGYLRKKIDQPYPHKLIHSIRGFGYTIKQ